MILLDLFTSYNKFAILKYLHQPIQAPNFLYENKIDVSLL